MFFTEKENSRFLEVTGEYHRRFGRPPQHLAAAQGDLKSLAWFVDIGIYVNNIVTIDWAAREGQLEAVKWLKEHGCPCDEATVLWASRNGHDAVVKWLVRNTELAGIMFMNGRW